MITPGLHVLEIKHLSSTHFAVAQIRFGGEDLYFVSWYFQFGHDVQPYIDRLKEILDNLRGKKVVIGIDANARSTLWYNPETNNRGSLVEDLVIEENLEVINSPSPYPTHQDGGNIDLSLTTRQMGNQAHSWKIIVETSISDHLLTQFSIMFENQIKIPFRGYTMEKEKDAFNISLEERMTGNPPPDDPVERAILFQKLTEKTCSAVLKKRSNRLRTVPWWTNEHTIYKRDANQSRRKHQACCPCPYKDVLRERFRIARNTFKQKDQSS